jgi:hypothetical protein
MDEDTSVEVEMSDEEFGLLEKYQKQYGFESLNDLVTYILKEELTKYNKTQG